MGKGVLVLSREDRTWSAYVSHVYPKIGTPVRSTHTNNRFKKLCYEADFIFTLASNRIRGDQDKPFLQGEEASSRDL